MKEHVERHIDGLSYVCQFCDKTFRSINTDITVQDVTTIFQDFNCLQETQKISFF